jgi:hypothetical protein
VDRNAPDVDVHQNHLAGVNAGSELGAGRVPVPAGLTWTVPIAIAGLVTLVAYLPSPAGRYGGAADRGGR